ncbi:MAG TPA: cytochrome c biogenesis protein ResB [Verrucomicrobiae bacterium]|nr:cytochrome c biogenesis protein ResB [Verrucomicrobiae bacterium]
MHIDRFIGFFTSLRLTVVCLGLGFVLVFAGTLAQVNLGVYQAQSDFFRSFFVYWPLKGTKIPVFPGGYLIGSLLLLNLIAAHIKRFKLSKKKVGLFLIHIGLIVLLLGQLLTDMLSVESGVHLRVGESKNYSEERRRCELAVKDVSDADSDKVAVVGEDALAGRKEVRLPEMPLTVRVRAYYANSDISLTNDLTGSYREAAATRGSGIGLWWKAQPRSASTDVSELQSGLVEIFSQGKSLGTWLVSEALNPQTFTFDNRIYQIALRAKRDYQPFSLELLKFNHAIYKGTDIPKDFSSRVRLRRPDTGEDREVLIYMNNPLRYGGKTFYQASYDPDDRGTVLQVVRNPGWLTPYFSCALMALGMLIQFLSHLVPFLKARLLT